MTIKSIFSAKNTIFIAIYLILLAIFAYYALIPTLFSQAYECNQKRVIFDKKEYSINQELGLKARVSTPSNYFEKKSKANLKTSDLDNCIAITQDNLPITVTIARNNNTEVIDYEFTAEAYAKRYSNENYNFDIVLQDAVSNFAVVKTADEIKLIWNEKSVETSKINGAYFLNNQDLYYEVGRSGESGSKNGFYKKYAISKDNGVTWSIEKAELKN